MQLFNIFKYFSDSILNVLEEYFRKEANPTQYISLEEIRLRNAEPVILKFNSSEVVLNYIVSSNDIFSA